MRERQREKKKPIELCYRLKHENVIKLLKNKISETICFHFLYHFIATISKCHFSTNKNSREKKANRAKITLRPRMQLQFLSPANWIIHNVENWIDRMISLMKRIRTSQERKANKKTIRYVMVANCADWNRIVEPRMESIYILFDWHLNQFCKCFRCVTYDDIPAMFSFSFYCNLCVKIVASTCRIVSK